MHPILKHKVSENSYKLAAAADMMPAGKIKNTASSQRMGNFRHNREHKYCLEGKNDPRTKFRPLVLWLECLAFFEIIQDPFSTKLLINDKHIL